MSASCETIPLSVLVPVKNEAHQLARCLMSVSWADEIIVVDSHSTDGTRAVSEECAARVVDFTYTGRGPKKKNWALENIDFKHEWVLILDADEHLPTDAREEIAKIVRDANHPLAGYWINRRFMFMGKWLKHAYFPNWNLRLFKHRLGRYEVLTDEITNSGDNEVHEHLIVQGQTGRLCACMDHYAFSSIEVFVEKHNRYSNWEAVVASSRKRRGSALQHPGVGFRRQLKAISRSLPGRSWLRFLYVYVVQRGFLDGREGYIFARLHGYYEFLSAAKTYELSKGSLQRPTDSNAASASARRPTQIRG